MAFTYNNNNELRDVLFLTFLQVLNSTIVTDHDVFKSLHQLLLDIACLSCFHGSIDQTLLSHHSMEKEFLWGQSMKV
jgi:hypothetical protein